jgi:cation diffusion facilitator family transporter
VERTRLESAERAFRFGLVGNGALVVVKLLVGWLSGSRALLADGWHSIGDVAVNLGAWLAHRFSRREPDDDHHYGHGKLEAFAGLLVGVLLVATGVAVALTTFTSKATLDPGWRGTLALVVAVGSILTNLVLARVAQIGSRDAKSASLAALARDNASDALASVLVVLAIVGTRMGLAWAEPLASFVIGLLIIWMGLRSARDGFDVLMDRADPGLRRKVVETALSVAEVRGVQSTRVHPLGHHAAVDMQISVDGALTVEEGHRIAHSVERAVVRAHSHVGEVHVHVNPGASPPGPVDEPPSEPPAQPTDGEPG